MEESMKKVRERLEDEFRQVSASEKWDTGNVEMMKNLLKSMYYIDVICAMKNGEDYPGSEYMPAMSYARGGHRRNALGQYSYASGHYPMSSRRYYDDEMGNVIHKLEYMMDNEMNPEKRKAIQDVLNEIQMR